MHELLQKVLEHLRGMWHRRWIGLAAAWVAAIIGVAIVYRIPEKYEASARVYVDTEIAAQAACSPVSPSSRTWTSRWH